MPEAEEVRPGGPSWNEVFHGPAIAAVMKKFDECLLQVERRHQDYFDELTEQADEAKKPVRLTNFTTIVWGHGQLQFGTNPELREDIAAECRACIESLKQ